jgi:N-acetylneuraminic acid mutarotase
MEVARTIKLIMSNWGVEKGVFNDVYIFNMDKKIWKRSLINGEFGHCFGMASTCVNGSIFIFGGSNHSLYADASIKILWNGD